MWRIHICRKWARQYRHIMKWRIQKCIICDVQWRSEIIRWVIRLSCQKICCSANLAKSISWSQLWQVNVLCVDTFRVKWHEVPIIDVISWFYSNISYIIHWIQFFDSRQLIQRAIRLVMFKLKCHVCEVTFSIELHDCIMKATHIWLKIQTYISLSVRIILFIYSRLLIQYYFVRQFLLWEGMLKRWPTLELFRYEVIWQISSSTLLKKNITWYRLFSTGSILLPEKINCVSGWISVNVHIDQRSMSSICDIIQWLYFKLCHTYSLFTSLKKW